jgi:lysophospholipase L1-like esterase
MQQESQNYLVFCFGVNDVIVERGARRVSFEQSLETARAMISEAADWLPTRWIGPPPVAESSVQSPLVELHHAYAQLARELSVPYLSMIAPLGGDGRYMNDVRARDRFHPSAVGYALWAEHVAAWSEWFF